MTTNENITYTCSRCGYPNTWTRDEILKRGTKVVYRDPEMDRYSLPCKNPTLRPQCPERRVIDVPRKEA